MFTNKNADLKDPVGQYKRQEKQVPFTIIEGVTKQQIKDWQIASAARGVARREQLRASAIIDMQNDILWRKKFSTSETTKIMRRYRELTASKGYIRTPANEYKPIVFPLHIRLLAKVLNFFLDISFNSK